MHLSAVQDAVQDNGSTIEIGFKRSFFWPGMALMLCDLQGRVSLVMEIYSGDPLVFLPSEYHLL
jgi:hypothetical protein